MISFSNIYFLNFLNCILFLILSLTFNFLKIKGFYEVIPSILFFFLNLYPLMTFIFKNSILSIYQWAITFASCFIFFGTVGSFLRYELESTNVFLNVSISLANTFNALSLTIITLICLFLVKNNEEKMSLTKMKNFFDKIFDYHKYLFFILIIIFIIKLSFYLQGNPSNFYLSFLTKLTILENGLFLCLFICFYKLNNFKKIIFILFFILNLIFNLSFLSKFLVLKLLILALVGLFVTTKSKLKFCTISICIISASFFILNPFINLARIHNNFIMNKNDFISKIKVIYDTSVIMVSKKYDKKLLNNFNKNFVVFNINYFKEDKQDQVKKIQEYILSSKVNDSEMDEFIKKFNKFKKKNVNQFHNPNINAKHFIKSQLNYFNRLKMITYRLDVVSTQRFLIEKYLKNEKGNSLKNLIYIFIPRFIWKDKPIMTSNSVPLHNMFYGNYKVEDGNYQFSGLAPSIHIEALWNYGILGFFFISIFFGIYLSFFSNILINSNSPIILFGYIMIFDPLLSVVLFYESWIISFLGQSIIFIVIFFLIVITLKMLSKLKIINL